ncbi:MAG TPA: hypothetical protein DCL80_05945 [Balneola sp.]|nr:hypothetical protein [Balneola sp.]
MKIYTLLFFLLITSATNAQVQDLIEREAAYHHFNGNVLVQSSSSINYEASFGYADLEKETSIHKHSRFDIGSLTKKFTAAAILHLVHDGKINLDDRINDHLGSFANNKWKKVTIHQLLTHTSGIPSIYQTEQGLDIFFPEEEPIALEDLILKFSEGKLISSPGKEFNYSNSGYVLLAAIIENVTGSTFEEYLQRKIFDAYGLEHTSFLPDSNSALPYFGYLPSNIVRAPIYHYSWSIGAGGVYSTTHDLSTWVEVITSDNFLTQELRATFITNHTRDLGNLGYGYGWQITRDGIVEHDGGTYGFISFLSFDPKTKDHHVLLTNRSFESITDFGKSGEKIRSLSNKIWDIKNGKEIEIHPKRSDNKIASHNVLLDTREQIVIEQTETGNYVFYSGSNLSDIIPNTAIAPDSELNKKVLNISNHLEKGQYWRFASYCNGEMKFVAYSGLFRLGFSSMRKRVGDNLEIIPFLVNESSAMLRMKGDDGSLHLIIYFNEEGKVMGVYDRNFYSPKDPQKMKAYPIGENQLFIDGFPYGENSATLTLKNDTVVIEQFGREVSFKKK